MKKTPSKSPTFNKTAALLGVMLTACGNDALYRPDLGSDAGTDNGEISLEARYQYDPPPNMGADRANLEGVTPQDIRTLANWVRNNADAVLEIDLKTIDPEDANLDATRLCDEVELFGGDQYVRCKIKEMLPQGPNLSPGKTFVHDQVTFSADTGLDLASHESTEGPAIYKDRVSNDGTYTYNSSFFLNEEHAARTGELRRWWRVRVAGRK